MDTLKARATTRLVSRLVIAALIGVQLYALQQGLTALFEPITAALRTIIH